MIFRRDLEIMDTMGLLGQQRMVLDFTIVYPEMEPVWERVVVL